MVLKTEGFSPYRCRECDHRFIQRSLHPGRMRSRAQSWAGVLGIRDAKTRRRKTRMAVAAVLTVLALLFAFLLLGYLTRPTLPVDAVSAGPSQGATLASIPMS